MASTLDTILASVQASATGLPGLVGGLLGAGGLYKLIEKWMDNRNEEAKRRAEAQTSQSEKDAERRSELEALILPLNQKAAALEWCEKDNQRLERENIALRSQVNQLQIDLIQEKTISGGLKAIAELFSDNEGQNYLRRKALERHQREQAEIAARRAAENEQNPLPPT